MTARSMPEALLHWYITRYVDASATLNSVRVDRYTADITFNHSGILYDLEFDSLSGHSDRIIKDWIRDTIFRQYGYQVIRFRNSTKTKTMPDVPDCLNVLFPLNFIGRSGTFPRWQIEASERGLSQLMQYLGIQTYDIDIERDYNTVIDLYFPGIPLKRITIKA